MLAAVATIGFFLKRRAKGGKSALRTLIDPTAKYALPLVEKEEINHDTRRFR